MSRTLRTALLLLIVVVSSLTPAWVNAQAQASSPTTYIELILDSSISMTARVEGSKTRMDVAKSVMEQIIRELPDDPNLRVALRIYGAELDPALAACSDTILVQPFAPVGQARQNMIDQVKSMRARGMTPIALSLEQAAKDFPDKSARNIVVLVTDGEESCGGDPCAVSARLQAQGMFVKPYVVGFALNEKQASLVRCIGDYFAASDTASLRQALSTIMARAIAPAIIDVQAWAASTNVTRQANIQITKSTGELASSSITAQEPATVRAQVDEGTYTVRGWFQVGTQILTAEVSGVTATSGKTSGVRLDFGPMEGTVRVIARSSGQDVSSLIGISALKSGQFVTAAWTGIPPTAKLPAGDYTFIIAHRQYPQLTKTAMATVRPGEETIVDVDLGSLPASLEVTVTYRGNVVSNLCQLTVATPGQPAQVVGAPVDGKVFRYSSNPGTVDLNVTYKGLVSVDKAVPGVELVGGRTTPVEVKLDDVLGNLRVRVTAGGRDVTSEAKVVAARGNTNLELPYVYGVREGLVPPAVYAVTAGYRGIESDMYEAYVKPGELTELTIDVRLPGTIVIVPTIEGKTMAPNMLRAWAQLSGETVGHASVQYGRVEISIPEGTYTVVGEISDPFQQRREAVDIQVLPGQTTEVKLDFDPAGLVRLRVIADGKPADARAWVYFGGTGTGDYASMNRVANGVWELKVPEGVHDIEIDPETEGFENRYIRDIEVVGGATVERTLDLGGTGLVRLNVIADGKPTDARAWIYVGGTYSGNYFSMSRVANGVWELRVPEGLHDIEIDPEIEGFENQFIRGVEVPGGSTVERTLDLGGTGLVRLRVVSDGQPADARAWIYVGGTDSGNYFTMSKVASGVWELRVPAGLHDIEVDPELEGLENKFIRDIEVAGGVVVERTLELSGNGLVRLRVLVDGKPAAGGAYLYHDGMSSGRYTTMRRVAEGVWELTVAEGVHDIEFDPELAGMDNKVIRDVEVVGGSTVERTLDLGGSGLVRLRVTVDGKPAAGGAYLYHDGMSSGRYTTMRRVAEGVWEITVPEGIHDIEFDPELAGMENKIVRDVEVVGGGTVEKTLNLGGSGLVRLRVTVDGKPAAGGAYLYHDGMSSGRYTTMRRVAEGVWEITVPEGIHDIEFDPDLAGMENKIIRDVEVVGGGTVEKTLNLGGSGLVRLRVTVDGKPAAGGAYLYHDGMSSGRYTTMRRVAEGVWEITVPEGIHDIEFDPDLAGMENKLIRDVEVVGGGTVEKTLSLGGSGLVRLRVLVDGKPAAGGAYLYHGGRSTNKYTTMRKVAEGVWEITVPEGIHDIEFDPDLAGMENKLIRDVEVVGGSTVEKTFDLGGSGLVRLRVLVDGKPAAGGAYLYHGGRSTNKYTTMRKVSDGVWEITVPEGIHDIEFDPDLAGLDNKLIRDVEVVGGRTVEKTLDLGGSGLVRLRVLLDGKPAAGGAYLYHGGRSTNKYTTMRKVSEGVWEITVPEGVHDIQFDPDLAGLDDQLITGIEVTSKGTVEKTLDLGGSGLLRVNFTYQGQPANASVRVYFGGRATNKYASLRRIQTGVYELRVPAGVHDIEVDPDASGVATQLIRDVEIKGDSVVEKTLSL